MKFRTRWGCVEPDGRSAYPAAKMPSGTAGSRQIEFEAVSRLEGPPATDRSRQGGTLVEPLVEGSTD